jgi:hypothetical protein
MPAAVGAIWLSQKTTITGWPTPAGLGATLRYAYVGMFHWGVWALVVGISVTADVIEIINNTVMKIAAILFFEVFILFFPFIF